MEDAIRRRRPRILVDARFCGALQPGRQSPAQGVFNWLVSLDADANLFSRLTIGLTGRRFHWGAHRKTLLLRTTTNYQFTRRVGLRLFHERVIERTAGTTDDNFNTVLDYEFTPESHFFFAFVRDRNRSRAVFSKIAYLFGGV